MITDKIQRELAKSLSRELRHNATKAEQIFWNVVRDRKFHNLKFYRQKVLFYSKDNKPRFFIADFYCHEKRLVIELDGDIHKKQKRYDEARSEIIQIMSIDVIRFKNIDIENRLDDVLDTLEKKLKLK